MCVCRSDLSVGVGGHDAAEERCERDHAVRAVDVLCVEHRVLDGWQGSQFGAGLPSPAASILLLSFSPILSVLSSLPLSLLPLLLCSPDLGVDLGGGRCSAVMLATGQSRFRRACWSPWRHRNQMQCRQMQRNSSNRESRRSRGSFGEGDRHCLSLRFSCRSAKD